jgi:hypothetical protein
MEPGTSLPRRLLSGAADGAAATLVMSGAMLAAQRAGAIGELPPRKITAAALRRVHVLPPPRREKDALGALSHVAFGAAAGALFEAALGRGGRRAGPLAGVAFGLGVWLVSYAGWVPALGILPPPHRDRPGRQVTMVVAHLVYGAALGALARRRPRRAAAAAGVAAAP